MGEVNGRWWGMIGRAKSCSVINTAFCYVIISDANFRYYLTRITTSTYNTTIMSSQSVCDNLFIKDGAVFTLSPTTSAHV